MKKRVLLLALGLVLLSGLTNASSLFVQEIPIQFEGIDIEIKGLVVEGKTYVPMEEGFELLGFDWYYEDGRVYVFALEEEELDEYDLWDYEQDEYDQWDYEGDEDDWDSEDDDYEYDFEDHYWEWEEELTLESWFVDEYEYVEIEFIDDKPVIPGFFSGVLLDGKVYLALREAMEEAGLYVEYREGEVIVSFPFDF